MNQRPLVLLFPAAVGTVAALIYACSRRQARSQTQSPNLTAQVESLRRELQDQRRVVDDIDNYLRPLRQYSSQPHS